MAEKKKRKVGAFAKQMGVELRRLKLKGKPKAERQRLFKKAAAAAKRKVNGGKTDRKPKAAKAQTRKARAGTKARRPAKETKAARPGRVAKRRAARRPDGFAIARGAFAPRRASPSRSGLALPTPGFTPVPIRPALRSSAEGTAGARSPSLNGSTMNGQLIVPRLADGARIVMKDLPAFKMKA